MNKKSINIPEKYKPEWRKLGIKPYKAATFVGDDGMTNLKTTVNNRRGLSPINEAPHIKNAESMESPIESVWFDAEDQPSDHTKMINDNEDVVCKDIQKINVTEETFDSIEEIRKKILEKSKTPVQESKPKVKVGDFIVLYNNTNIFVSNDENEVKDVCEKLIIENADLGDDDLAIFYRVSLGKFFK